MKRIFDLHHHLDTLQSFAQLRSKLQHHIYRLEDHRNENYQTVISVSIYAWQSFGQIVSMIKNLKSRIHQLSPKVQLITKKSDLYDSFQLGIILHVESGRLIQSPADQLVELYELGVRGIIALHFVDNFIGKSCDDPLRRFGLKGKDSGLTDAGFWFIEQMNHLGMWVDVTHTTDKTADDILSAANEVMASHVAIRDLTPRMRNKPLNFLKRLSEKNGIFGLLPWQHLVGEAQDGYFQHMKLAVEEGLDKHICLGTDFGAPIKTHNSIKSLYDCVSVAEQFDASEDIIFQNAFNFFKRVLPD